MYTQANGKIVILEDGDNQEEVIRTCMCKCGHALYLHSWVAWVPGTIHTSQCTACGFVGEKNDEFGCKHFEAA